MTSKKEALQAILRSELYPFIRKSFEELNPATSFVENWHIEAVAWHLEQFEKKKIKRLIIALPPRNLKSISASVALPAWLLGRNPSARVVCASYAEPLASKFGRDTERIMQSDWYKNLFPKTKIKRAADREIELTDGGNRYATSVGGSLTGMGGGYIVIDDPIKAGDAMSEAERKKVIEWYRQTVYSRLDNKNDDGILLVMQRVHVDDLAGFLIDQGGWTLLNLPAVAIDNEQVQITDNRIHFRKAGDLLNAGFEGHEVLEEAKLNLGSAAYSAQYQQQPVPEGGQMILKEWFKEHDYGTQKDRYDLMVQSWDTASGTDDGNSYSVCLTFGILENRYYLLDVVRERLNFPDLVTRVIRNARVWEPSHILIEKASSGFHLLDLLKQQTELPLIAMPADTDKIVRVSRVSSYIEAGRMFLPREAKWLADFYKEVLAFPSGKFDDQVDALAHFLYWAQWRDRKPPSPRAYLVRLGGSGDKYRDRTGISCMPPGF